MANETGAVTTMVPLLFLVVTELSTIGRDVNLDEAVNEERDPLGFPILRVIFPPLGRFNFVHGSNLVILSSGLVLISLLSEGWVRLGTSLLTLVMFIVLPVLEVDEYGKILGTDTESGPLSNVYSFHVHLILTVAITLYIVLLANTIPPNPVEGFKQPREILPFFSGLVFLIGTAYLLFTWVLYVELDDVSGRVRIPEVRQSEK